jgi:hypothetical protein
LLSIGVSETVDLHPYHARLIAMMTQLSAISAPVPRETTETTQVSVRIPDEWVDALDELAIRMSPLGVELARADVLRAAISLGIERLKERYPAPGAVPAPAAPTTTKKRR